MIQNINSKQRLITFLASYQENINLSFVNITKLIPQASENAQVKRSVPNKETRRCIYNRCSLKRQMLQTGTINLSPCLPSDSCPPEGRIVIHVPLPQFFRVEVPEKKPFRLLCLISEQAKGHREIKFCKLPFYLFPPCYILEACVSESRRVISLLSERFFVK